MSSALTLPPGLVRIRSSDGSFLGTGLVVTVDSIVTCAHVLAGEATFYVEVSSTCDRAAPRPRREAHWAPLPAAGDAARAFDDTGERHEDLALLRVIEGDLTPLPLVHALTPAVLKSHSGELAAQGFSGPDGIEVSAQGLWLRGALLVTAEGYVRSGQIDGGVPHGFSGAPLLLPWADGWAVAGLFYLGGEAAGQSVFYGSDLLISLSARHGSAPSVCCASRAERRDARDVQRAPSPRAVRSSSRLATWKLRATLAAIVVIAWLGIRFSPEEAHSAHDEAALVHAPPRPAAEVGHGAAREAPGAEHPTQPEGRQAASAVGEAAPPAQRRQSALASPLAARSGQAPSLPRPGAPSTDPYVPRVRAAPKPAQGYSPLDDTRRD
jgi:hypothetical protein